MTVPAYLSDATRLSVLRHAVLLDTPAERAFDRLTGLASKILNAPVALVSLVDEDRQFFKSCLGLPEPWASERETPLSHSFCQHAVDSKKPLIIEDARLHPLVADNLAIRDLGVVAYAGIPLIVDGEALGSFCVIDNKPRAWTEDEVAMLSALADSVMSEIELRTTAQQLRKALHNRNEMAAMISHDLRNPASLTVSASELLKEEWLTAEQRSAQVDIIDRAGRRMLRLIDDLLTTAQLESGVFSNPSTVIDLTDVLKAVLSDRGLTRNSNSASLHAQLSDETFHVNADADLMRRVLDNLLDNAFKFTPAEGSVTVTSHRDHNTAIVRVTDTGAGIAPENITRLFDRYVQLQSGRRGSAGLGLAIARGITEAFGGQLYVAESTLGKGTTFEILLPLGISLETSQVAECNM